MNKMSEAQRRKIFKLAGEKGLDNDTLHAYVHTLTGKSSLKYLSITDAIKVIDNLEGKKQNVDYMITEKQRRFIEGLAKEIGWKGEDNQLDAARLNGWLKSKFNVDNLRWLTAKKASDVIEGLKIMKGRTQERLCESV